MVEFVLVCDHVDIMVGYIGIMEKKMETTISESGIWGGLHGIMEKKMGTILLE